MTLAEMCDPLLRAEAARSLLELAFRGEEDERSTDELCAGLQEKLWPQPTQRELCSVLEAMYVGAGHVAADHGLLSEILRRVIGKVQHLPSRPRASEAWDPTVMTR